MLGNVWRVRSLLFNYLENRKIYGKLVLDINCVIRFSLQRLFETVFAAINV
jgi:hypothetical protein